MNTLCMNSIAGINEKGSTVEVLRIGRDSCGKSCTGFARLRRVLRSACASLRLTLWPINLIRPDRRTASWDREFQNLMTNLLRTDGDSVRMSFVRQECT